MDKDPRELPTWKMSMLSKHDVMLNQLPTNEILQLFHERKIMIFVDRGFAIQAASSGVKVSVFTVLLSVLIPVFLLAIPVTWYFFSWVEAVIAFILAVGAFRASRAGVVSNVRKQALKDPRLLDLLISKGVIWSNTLFQPAVLRLAGRSPG